jgi:hypothetical protein
MSNKSPWSEALDKKILKWVEAKGMYEGWYDGLSHKWKHGVINQIREFFPAVIEDFQELKESLLESPARLVARTEGDGKYVTDEEIKKIASEAFSDGYEAAIHHEEFEKAKTDYLNSIK